MIKLTKLAHLARALRRGACVMVAVLAVAGMAPSALAAPASWNDTGFAIDTKGMRLNKVLEQFGAAYGVQVNNSVTDAAPLNMRLKASSGTEFLDRLGATGEFRWFYYNNTVYVVSRNDQVSVRLEVGEDAVADAKSALVGVGLFDARFGWGELPDEGVVMVSGPRAYVELVRGLLLPEQKVAAIQAPQKGKQIMVFRLKYASAADRIMTTRGVREVVPGIKTILSGLLDGNAGNGAPPKSGESEYDLNSHKRSGRGTVTRGAARQIDANGAPIVSGGDVADDGGEKKRSKLGGTAGNNERPRIDADPSLNAIIIYDDVAKRSTYLQLISELDVEPQQIEIEALIVDIDRSKLSELGVEWGTKGNGTNVTVNGTMADSAGVDLPLPGATLLINNAARFYARLKAMEGTGDARVLAKPTVLTLDNVAAVLDLSQTAYVSLLGERVADLADITVGTMLRVVPRIVQEGATTRVRLEVDIEDGSMADGTVNKNGAPNNPKVTRSTITTQAIVDGQQTLMIGGYHSESISRQDQKVPVLGDVPLLGGLFRSKAENHSTRERLFLITPRITATAGMAAAALSKANRSARRLANAEAKKQIKEELSEQDVRPAPGLASLPRTVPPTPPGQVPAQQPSSQLPASQDYRLPPAPDGSLLRMPLPAPPANLPPPPPPVRGRTAAAGPAAASEGFRMVSVSDPPWQKSSSILCKRPRPLLWK